MERYNALDGAAHARLLALAPDLARGRLADRKRD